MKLILSFLSEQIVKEDSFELPSNMSRTEIAEFFYRQTQAEPLYWQKLSFTFIILLSQLRSAKKDIKKLLLLEGDENLLEEHSLKELHTKLKKEAGVVLSDSQMDLLNTFIDP